MCIPGRRDFHRDLDTRFPKVERELFRIAFNLHPCSQSIILAPLFPSFDGLNAQIISIFQQIHGSNCSSTERSTPRRHAVVWGTSRSRVCTTGCHLPRRHFRWVAPECHRYWAQKLGMDPQNRSCSTPES